MSMNFKIRHGAVRIPVMFVTHDEINEMGRDVLEDGEFLFGMYRALQKKIYLNSSNEQWFETFIHELFEHIQSAYSLQMTHEQLSVMARVLADIMKQNAKQFIKLLEEDN